MVNEDKERVSFPAGPLGEPAFIALLSRLSTLNQIGAAIAHEIHQPLTAIVAYLEAAARLAPESPPAPLGVAIVGALEQARRATGMVRHLGLFARAGAGQRELVPVRQLLAEAEALISIKASQYGVRLDIGFDSDAAVVADRAQIQQVLLDLMGNAIDAMEQTAAASLCVRGEASGAHILVRVIDNGPGIPMEVAARLFEPFVTTKANSIGFGLALCRAIIQAHSGELWLATEAAEGATFCFTLPVASTP
jgi:two-component system sensor kinase FixL